MKILHVITGLQKAAGTSVFCGELANGLVRCGHDVTIAVCDPAAADAYPIGSRIDLVSIATIIHSPTSTLDFDLIHIHALWSPILHKVAVWAQQAHIPIVWSPHGMITPWAMRNKWWKKWLGWHLYQKGDLASAALLHATAQSEVDDVRRMGLMNNVVIAPLGVNIGRADREKRAKKTLLFVSRVQRKKGLPMLLEAWVRLPSDLRNEWCVRVVGPDEGGHVAELKALVDKLDIASDVLFVGPVYGRALASEYASADLFVLPTHSENFGSVVIESLAQGVPVITTKGTPWQELETHRCGWWTDVSTEGIEKVLHEAMALADATRAEMGQRGRKLVEDKYTWSAVVKAMVKGYEEALNGKA